MAHNGPAGKVIKHGRGASAEWTEVANAPYDGPSPDLPKPRRGGVKWQPEVEEWWKTVRRMPHCILWEESDWSFALETAFMKNDWWLEYHNGVVKSTKSTEIRRREDQLGTTREARRQLRILYVDVSDATDEEPESAGAATGGNVTPINSRRERVTQAG